jgi:hypothetical protein
VADGADATNAGRKVGHFPEDLALAEFFKAAELGVMEASGNCIAGIIELDGNLSMSFYPCYRINFNCFTCNISPL